MLNKKNLKVCLLLLKLLANGKYFMSEEEIEEEKAMDEDEPKKDNATRLQVIRKLCDIYIYIVYIYTFYIMSYASYHMLMIFCTTYQYVQPLYTIERISNISLDSVFLNIVFKVYITILFLVLLPARPPFAIG